jgi:hypothetical protein
MPRHRAGGRGSEKPLLNAKADGADQRRGGGFFSMT